MGEDDFGVAVGEGGVSGDVVGDFVLSPGVDAASGEVLVLEGPEFGLGEGFGVVDAVGGVGESWHGSMERYVVDGWLSGVEDIRPNTGAGGLAL